jgi:ankyrin repeat protein
MISELETVLAKIRRADLIQFADVSLDGPNVKSPLSGETPLHIVAVWGDTEAACILLDAGAEVDVPGEDDCTPLHEAIIQGHVETTRLLLSRGADPKRRCRLGDAYELAALSKDENMEVLFEKEV